MDLVVIDRPQRRASGQQLVGDGRVVLTYRHVQRRLAGLHFAKVEVAVGFQQASCRLLVAVAHRLHQCRVSPRILQ